MDYKKTNCTVCATTYKGPVGIQVSSHARATQSKCNCVAPGAFDANDETNKQTVDRMGKREKAKQQNDNERRNMKENSNGLERVCTCDNTCPTGKYLGSVKSYYCLDGNTLDALMFYAVVTCSHSVSCVIEQICTVGGI